MKLTGVGADQLELDPHTSCDASAAKDVEQVLSWLRQSLESAREQPEEGKDELLTGSAALEEILRKGEAGGYSRIDELQSDLRSWLEIEAERREARAATIAEETEPG